jgi:MFS family permease
VLYVEEQEMKIGFETHRNVPLLFAIRIFRGLCVDLIWTTWPLFVQELGATVFEVGLVWALGGLVNVVLMIPLSVFSDRFGRRISILLSFACTIVANLGYTRTTSWEELILFKIIADVAWVLSYPAEAAMIADISTASTRGRLYGLLGVAMPIGSIGAPLLGGLILDNYGWNAVFFSIVGSALIALLPSLLLLETRKQTSQSKEKRRQHTSLPTLTFKGGVDYNFLFSMTIFALFNFFIGIQMGLSQITPIYLKERFDATSLQQGLFFSVGTMVPFLVIQLIGGWLADKYDRRRIIVISVAIWPFLMALWPHTDSYYTLLLLRGLLTSTWVSMPALQAYLMDYTDVSSRGLASGISMLGQRLGGTVFGTSLLGYLYERYDQIIPFYVAAVFPLPAIPLIYFLKEKWKVKEKK